MIVATPLIMIARFGFSPMTMGKTNVAPNIATTCWAPMPMVRGHDSRSSGPPGVGPAAVGAGPPQPLVRSHRRTDGRRLAPLVELPTERHECPPRRALSTRSGVGQRPLHTGRRHCVTAHIVDGSTSVLNRSR